MARIVIRPRAFADLVEIWSYIAADSPVAADSLLFSIDRKVRALGHQPGIGRERPELGVKVRSVSHKKYVILYSERPGGIDIVRVLHGSRDIESVFQEEGY